MVNHVVVHLTLLLALPLSTPAYSQLDPSWRFWFTSDGMAESYTRSVSAGPGAIWLRHGNTKLMNTFDGYRMSSLPEPRLSQTSEVQWSKAARVYGSLCGDAWTVEDRGLKQFTGGSWITRGKSNDADPMLHAVPLKDCRVAVLYGDRLVAYNPSNKIWVLLQRSRDADIGSFRTLVPGLTGELWIGGEHGVARLMMDGAASGLQWSTYPTSGFGIGDLKHLLPSDDGSLHVTGTSQRSQDYVALRLERGRFSTIYQSSQPLRSWRGDNATTWVLESTTLWRLHGGQKHRIERRGALSGIVYDVTTEARGVFWIATSVGLARHAPPHWRSPDEIAGLDEPVHAIVEDEQRGLWFAGNTNLIHFDGIRWTIHPLPRDHQTHTTQTTALAYLNGRIVVPAMVKSEGDVVLSFNPKSRRWTEVKHPSGRPVTLAWRASPDRYYVRVGGPCALEEYDGLRFFPRPEVAAGPFCSKVRYLFENERGLYIGTTAMGAGHVYNGVVAAIGASEGLPENAVYTIFEDSPGRLLMGARDTLSEFDGKHTRVILRGIDAVRSIIRTRSGQLWMATGSGIYRRLGSTWLQNDESDGLPADTSYTVFEDSGGRVWAGTSRGISLYDTKADVDPPLARIPPEFNLREAPADGNFQLTLHAADRWKRNDTGQLLFSYRLDDLPWTPFSKSQSAIFQKLAHGSHSVRVRAMDRNGNQGPVSEPFLFDVAVPWYKHTGFVATAILSIAAIAILLGLAFHQYSDLRRAKQTAEAASRCKSEFLANMSHEIRTPMNAILGMTAFAIELAATEEQREYLNTVQSSSESLLALLNDILDVSKVEAGKLELYPVDFEIRPCLAAAVRTLEFRAREKSLGFSWNVDSDVPTFVRGDSQRLRQVLINLLGNAIKFTTEGEVRLNVSTIDCSDSGIHLQFRISDTGVGVPPEKQSMIFAPFEQADSSATRVHGGTGLGLAISRQLVGLMGGAICVESPWHDGSTGCFVRGSRFTFSARFAPGKELPKVIARPVASNGVQLRVLLTEDNPVNQLLARRLIEKLGHTVAIANDGVEAVELFDPTAIDVILMDIQMPRMDGFEASRAIRAKEKEQNVSRRTPIVALTAHALAGDRERCLDAGMDEYLTKPIHTKELARVLAEIAGQLPCSASIPAEMKSS